MGFPRQEYWSGLPFPSPGELPDPGTEPRSPALQADALPTELCGKPVYAIHQRKSATGILLKRTLNKPRKELPKFDKQYL